jgi:broad-specificity NMP kinase
MNWKREDILEVLSWVEDSRESINSITTEFEYIVVSELFKRCADEIRALRAENDQLKNRRKKRGTKK